MIGPAQVLPRTLLLTRDHLSLEVADATIAEAFRASTVGVVVAADMMTIPAFVVAVETLRVLLAGMCVSMVIEVVGRDAGGKLQAPFQAGPWLDSLAAYRSQVAAPVHARRLDSSCRWTVGLGVAEGVDCELGAGAHRYWLRTRGARPSWQEATIWTAAGAAVLAAAEIYKLVVNDILGDQMKDPTLSPLVDHGVQVTVGEVGELPRVVEVISAGAITNVMLFMALRAKLKLRMRVWDSDVVETSNFNRYPLLDIQHTGLAKVQALAGLELDGLIVDPIGERFTTASDCESDVILVGADQVAPRHAAAARTPSVAIVGSTDHYLTLDSFHRRGAAGCPACLHPQDDGVDGDVPTVSFVSFAAGLESARFLACPPSADSWYKLTDSWLRLDSGFAPVPGPVPHSPVCPLPEAHP